MVVAVWWIVVGCFVFVGCVVGVDCVVVVVYLGVQRWQIMGWVLRCYLHSHQSSIGSGVFVPRVE